MGLVFLESMMPGLDWCQPDGTVFFTVVHIGMIGVSEYRNLRTLERGMQSPGGRAGTGCQTGHRTGIAGPRGTSGRGTGTTTARVRTTPGTPMPGMTGAPPSQGLRKTDSVGFMNHSERYTTCGVATLAVAECP